MRVRESPFNLRDLYNRKKTCAKSRRFINTGVIAIFPPRENVLVPLVAVYSRSYRLFLDWSEMLVLILFIMSLMNMFIL